jgi:hypothetical protein
VHRGWAHPCVPSLFLILALRLLVVSVLSTSMVIVLPVNVFTNICISPVVASETRAGAFDCCLRLRPPTVPFCTLDRVSPKPKSLRVLVRYLVGGDLPPMLFEKKNTSSIRAWLAIVRIAFYIRHFFSFFGNA